MWQCANALSTGSAQAKNVQKMIAGAFQRGAMGDSLDGTTCLLREIVPTFREGIAGVYRGFTADIGSGQPRCALPVDAVLLLGLAMAAVVVAVQIEARRADRRMAQVVAHETQIDLAVRHVRARAVTQPVRRCTFE